MSSMIPQAFVSTRIQPMLEPTSPIALLSLAVRKWIVVLNSPMSDMCRRRQTCETSVCRNAEHKVCSIVYRPRAPQETIAPMVRATRPPARRPRGHRCGHVPHVFRAMVSLGNNRGDASMPHELRPRSLARADRHARIISTYEAAGVPSLAASRGRTERRCRVDCWRSRGSRARQQHMLLQAAGPQRRGIRFGAAAPRAGSWSARRRAERARAGAEL